MTATASFTAGASSSGLPDTPAGPDPVIDRAIWERLRRAARLGQLQPEGFTLLDLLHDLHPDWRAEW